MVESFQRQGALDHRHLAARAVGDRGEAGVALSERRFLAKINLRGKPTKRFREVVAQALGCEPPMKPNTVATAGELAVLWLGPDEWLVVGPAGREAALADTLRGDLGRFHAAVTDVSEGRTVIALSGPHARDVLRKGCPLDVHPRAFKTGDCAQTTLAKAIVILHRTGDAPAYDVYVERSFADYLWSCLEDAAEEYGLAVLAG